MRKPLICSECKLPVKSENDHYLGRTRDLDQWACIEGFQWYLQSLENEGLETTKVIKSPLNPPLSSRPSSKKTKVRS